MDTSKRRIWSKRSVRWSAGNNGKNGVEKIIELELSEDEKDNFNKSIKAVQELFLAAKKLIKILIHNLF